MSTAEETAADDRTGQPEAVPRRARIAKPTDRPLDSMAELERHDGETYSSTLY